ncbi:hypothetical protein MKW98_021057 [Papaver atlanticum]|uniref:Uncharacterized protein n=1 Tax=Papaver atlanticum TaxID=357466 RepID=A0AAD4T9F2_9MAGN|nr:hypothetical protein MKW98_021057 [Papaver atlanticum]
MNTTTSVKQVRHVSTSTVLPATQRKDASTQNQRIELSPSDLRSLRRLYAQVGLLFAKPPESKTNRILISHLKCCLSKALDSLFPLAGRLAMTKHDEDGTISFYINCNSVGAEFIHSVAADVSLEDLLKPTYTPEIINNFFTLDGIPNYEGLSLPLLSVQVTELIDGIFVGVSMNHIVCDCTSFWNFFKLWSQISRGCLTNHHIQHPPPPVNLEPRWLPETTNFPIHLPFSSIDKLFVDRYVPDPLLRERSFYFTPEKIAKLKAKVNSDHNHTSTISALQAHIWIAITRDRNLQPNESVCHQVVICFRDRLDPPLGKGYFGNSIQMASATVTAGDLLVKGDKFGALLLNQAIESCGNVEIQRYWQSWVENPVLPSIYDLISPTNLWVVGSTRFDPYVNDFGWGAPLAVRTGSNFKYEGRIMTDPGPSKGVITVNICLPFNILQVLENDVAFMEIALLHQGNIFVKAIVCFCFV